MNLQNFNIKDNLFKYWTGWLGVYEFCLWVTIDDPCVYLFTAERRVEHHVNFGFQGDEARLGVQATQSHLKFLQIIYIDQVMVV
jgi:hypothetical protein